LLYILVAGGPCTGKTTLVRLLNYVLTKEGLRTYVIRDWAREIIREGKNGSNVPLPWTDRVAFEVEVVRRHLSDFRRGIKYSPDVILEDSGSIAPIAYCRVDGVELPEDIVSNIMKHALRLDLIIITEPLGGYITDNERWEERSYATRLHKEIVKVHKEVARNLNIEIIKAPPTKEPLHRLTYLINYVNSLLGRELRVKYLSTT